MKIRLILLLLLIVPNITLSFDRRYDREEMWNTSYNYIRVGVFQNKPVVFHENGVAKGLYPDLIRYIAECENWEIEWVFCGFSECLDLMTENKLDIMTSIVDVPHRREFATFSKSPTWDYYGMLFSYDPGITGLFDLEGKKIGGRKASVYTTELIKLLESFNINAEFIPYDDYDIVFDDLNAQKIDIAAVNNTFSYTKWDLGHVYQTPIVYSPFSSVWATPNDSVHIPKLKIIDRYVTELKNDRNSIYYKFKDEWFSRTTIYWTPERMFWYVAFPVSLVLLIMICYHYYRTFIMNIRLRGLIEERDKAVDELSVQEKFLNTILDSMPTSLSVYDQQRRPVTRNKKHYDVFGMPNNDYRLNVSTRLITSDYQHVLDDLFELEVDDRKFGIHMDIVNKDNEVIPYEYSVTPFIWNNEVLIMFIGMDISDRVKIEKEKTKLEHRLQQSQKMEAIGTLAGGIAHDFNNILTVILGYNELVIEELKDLINRTDETSDDFKRATRCLSNLDISLTAAHKAKGLVQQILTFSRKGPSNRVKLDVVKHLDTCLKMLRQTLPTTIEIQTDICDEVGNIYADATQFQQIVMNLCINSFHAMEETGGVLSIAAHKVTMTEDDLTYETGVEAGNFAKLSIRDTGHGIPKHIRDKIFHPYFTTKDVDKGTGMGLSIVHGIIKQYGGFIHLYSEEGEGVVFNLFIPMYNGESVIADDDQQIVLKGNEHILLVDDEELIVNVNKQLLENFGYRVTVMTGSVAALDLFKDDPFGFDLVITDQTMPSLTGYELATSFLLIRPELPIILCSGYSSIISDKKIKESGIRAFALKPILKNDLAKLIRKVLDNEERTE